MTKAIIFDVGDVLVDVRGEMIVNEASRLLNVNPGRVRIEWDKDLGGRFQKDQISEKDFWTILSGRLNVKLPNWRGYLEKEFSRRIKRREDLYSIAKKLKNNSYKIAILSNEEKPHARAHKKKGNYKIFFPVILSCEVGMRKPELRIYRYTTKKLGVKAEECIFIDDEREYLLPAKKLGMKTVLFKNSSQLREELEKLSVL